MIDGLYHIILGFIYAALAFLIIWTFDDVTAAALLASLFIFLREVTQQQTKRFESDVMKGWDVWNWSQDKLLETAVPVLFFLLIAIM